MIAFGDALPITLGRDDRELHLDLATVELSGQLEPGGRKHAEHLTVVREHARHEALDPDVRCSGSELLEEPRADAATLVLVGDRDAASAVVGSRSRT